jgi:predicted PurR-regulated permease PerM
MWVLGVEYPILLGVLAAVLELVPVIGPIVVGCIAFLIASATSIPLAVYTVIFFFVLQQIENHVFVPIVVGKSMKVHPVVVIISLIAGGRIAGFVGVILAVPIAVLVQEIFDYFAEKKERRKKMGLY